MIQAIGLTSAARRNRPLAVDDLTFEARPGDVTVLFGPAGAGKSAALRLMLQLSHGRGVALFRGRPLHRVPHVAREIGVLLGDVPGHPARTARGHLQMLTAVAGVPLSRADELLDVVGLSGLADQRLGTFSLGMDRRLGLAAALLGDPHTLVLDEPEKDLAPREASWLRGMLRGFADEGGLVLTTTSNPREATRTGDRIVTLEGGRLLADQDVASFARTRLRPRVAVTSPHAERLGSLLLRESRGASQPGTAGQGGAEVADQAEPLEVVHEGGGRISVYNSSCPLVGETAYRHGILVHQLADETGEVAVPAQPLARADGRGSAPSDTGKRPAGPSGRPSAEAVPLPPRLRAVPAPGPVSPLRYEWRRLVGVRSTWLLTVSGLLLALVAACWLGQHSSQDAARVLAGWPTQSPLPPVAAFAGVLGALSFGQEFRYPVLAPAQAPVPRRLGLLAAKLTVTALTAVLVFVLSTALNAVALHVLYGATGAGHEGFPSLLTLLAVVLLAVGSAWAGLLAAAVFRTAFAGAVAVLAVPLVVSPVVGALLAAPAASSLSGMTERAATLLLTPLPFSGDRLSESLAALLAQPVGGAMLLSLTGLFCVYLFGTVRGRLR